MIAPEILFWMAVAFLVHSYVVYPVLLWLLSGKGKNSGSGSTTSTVPTVTVMLAAHNEESVMERKIESTFQTHFLKARLQMLVGSDASDDATDDIVQRLSEKFSQLSLVRFEQRMGKAAIMNELSLRATGDILVLTDANVFFSEETLPELVRHFSDPAIGLVAGHILNPETLNDGVAKQESLYQRSENLIKYREGKLWGATMGAFGGCYAIRKKLFHPVPHRFIVDDFYITMKVIESQHKAIQEPKAICYEDAGHVMKEEFRRKSRIATGNFQVLVHFRHLLLPGWKGVAFAFLSHKVLRWLGPFFILLAWLCSFVLSFDSGFYRICFWIQTALMLVPLAEAGLRKRNIQVPGLRYVSHFFVMNLALLNGFLKYMNGVEHNVWKPTQRNP